MNKENKYQESIFDKIAPIMEEYQLAALKIQQLRANQGTNNHKAIVKQVRIKNIKAQEIKWLMGE